MGQISSRFDQRAQADCNTPSILCIGDNPNIPRSIRQIFGSFDVDVSTGHFSQQGIWKSISQEPDLIIADLPMPKGTDEDVLECIRRRSETQGASAVLRKPVPITNLIFEVSRRIELQQLAS